MKLYSLALIAAVAAAGSMEPDQTVSTDLAWTDSSNTTSNSVTSLTDRTNPPAPENPGVSGTITASTDAEGVGSLAIDLTGTWVAKFQNSNTYDKLYAAMGIQLGLDTTTTETAEDGTETTTTTSKKEMIVMGGTRDRAAGALDASLTQWDTSNAAGFDFKSSPAAWFNANDVQRNLVAGTWTATDSSVLDNEKSGTQKYFLGYTLKATRPFESTASLDIENLTTYDLTGATWVVDNQGQGGDGELNVGTMEYQINLAVPPPPAPEPEPTPEPTQTGATALATSAVAAAAILALF